MVCEHFHRQLNTALKTHTTSWMDALPLVVLGIRTALKENTNLMKVEMVYGTALHILGAFFASSPNHSLSDPINYVSYLKTLMQQLRPSISVMASTFRDMVRKDCSVRCL